MPWAQPNNVSIKIQNMDTLFRYVHSMDTFTKEYSCIHQIWKQSVSQLQWRDKSEDGKMSQAVAQIPWSQIKNVSIKSQFMDTLPGHVHDVDMFLLYVKAMPPLKNDNKSL